ncbi:MAG: PDZ domain-containing protein [Planctomycetales bacterium]|nr:PDZ domain-containing protein [Planctomycetales bacterium]
MAPLIQPPADQPAANRLPARPLPDRTTDRPDSRNGSSEAKTATASGKAANPANPSAKYRLPGPTPAVDPEGVKQVGALMPEKQSTATNSGAFGRSILKPLESDDSNTDPSASDPGQASIGIKGIEANPGYPAVQITAITENSLATRDGLRVGDYIFAIDGIPTPTVRALADQVSRQQPGQRVRLRIGRSGQVADVDVTLTSKDGNSFTTPHQPNKPTPNLSGQPAPLPHAPQSPNPVTLQPAIASTQKQPEIQLQIGADVKNVAGRRGVLVAAIQPGSLADQAGLQVNDRIVAIDKRLVSDSASFTQLLSRGLNQSSADVQLFRENQLVNLTLDLNAKQSITANGSTDENAKSDQQTTGNQKASESGSLAGGLGSVLGSVFGTKPNAAAGTPSPNGNQQAENAELPAPKVDALALESTDSDDKDSDDSKALRAEIQRLKQQLKSLESRLDN